MASTDQDVVIVGGGVIGSAIAYFLAAQPAFDGRIVVVEKDSTYERASTPRSAGSIRQQFSIEENILISKFCIEFLNSIHECLRVDEESPDVGFVEAGYLFLADPGGAAILRENHALQRQCNAAIDLLSPPELKDRFPWLEVDDLTAGAHGVEGEGWLDPYSLLQAFRRKARSLGVTYVDDEVVGLERDGSRVVLVRLRDGGDMSCDILVNAAGAVAADLAGMVGVNLPVRPRKRTVFVIRCEAELPRCPMVIDPTGLFFRPEGDAYICGIAPSPENDPDCLDVDVDYDQFEETVWPLLAARVPAFETLKMERAWAGHYAYNTFDQNAVIGPHPEIENILFANGFSGHGLQQSPAVGRAISELIAFGEYRTLDLSRLAFDRILDGEPLLERNIV
jgi:FAD-dependent oxidoreductase domain-containing protein 1